MTNRKQATKRKESPSSSATPSEKKRKTSTNKQDTASLEKFLRVTSDDCPTCDELIQAFNNKEYLAGEFKEQLDECIDEYLDSPDEEDSVQVKLGMTEFSRKQFTIDADFDHVQNMYVFAYDNGENGKRKGITSMSKVTDKKKSNCFTQSAKLIQGARRDGQLKIVLAVCKTNSDVELYISEEEYKVSWTEKKQESEKLTNAFDQPINNETSLPIVQTDPIKSLEDSERRVQELEEKLKQSQQFSQFLFGWMCYYMQWYPSPQPQTTNDEFLPENELGSNITEFSSRWISSECVNGMDFFRPTVQEKKDDDPSQLADEQMPVMPFAYGQTL